MAQGPNVQFCRQAPQLQDHGVSIERFASLRPGTGRQRDKNERKRPRDKLLLTTKIKLHMALILSIRLQFAIEQQGIASPQPVSVHLTSSLNLALLISPIPVHNSVHNRFLVTQTQPGINRLRSIDQLLISILRLGGPFTPRGSGTRSVSTQSFLRSDSFTFPD
jgi:hypothetical protein